MSAPISPSPTVNPNRLSDSIRDFYLSYDEDYRRIHQTFMIETICETFNVDEFYALSIIFEIDF